MDFFITYILPVHDIIVFAISILTNMCLIYIATFKSKRRDAYFQFVVVFATLNIIYATFIYVLDPELHAENEVFIIMSKQRGFSYLPLIVGDVGLVVFWVLCPAMVVMTTTQFIYRYTVICKGNRYHSLPHYMHIFNIMLSTLIFSLSLWLMKRNQQLNDEVGEHMAKEHDIDIAKTSIMGLALEVNDSWNLSGVLYLVAFDISYVLMVGIIVACSVAIYRKWRLNATTQTVKNVNRQIVSALIVQAIAPLVCNVVPFFLMITLPIFGLHLTEYVNIVLIFTTWFPMISASATILLIKEYKHAFIRIIPFIKQRNPALQTFQNVAKDSRQLLRRKLVFTTMVIMLNCASIMMRHFIIAAAILSSTARSAPVSSSYIWSPRRLACEYYGGTNTRCTVTLPNEAVGRNPGCFEETNFVTNETKVYCGLECEESDETTILRKTPQHRHECSMFYNYNLERRRKDWYIWRSGKCVNTTIEFDVLCGTPTNPREFYFKNEHLFEYDDAPQ